MEWRFHGKDRTKTLVIGPQVVFVQHTTYQRYENVRDEFVHILNCLAELFPGAQASRIGLRYVNSILLKGPGPTKWSSYLAPKLLSLFQFPPRDERIAFSRVFHNIDFAFDSFNLSFRFGMHNPDYPARIRQKIFILDLAAYAQSIEDVRNIGSSLDKYHAKIQQYFEQSITDKLRRIMNAE